MKDKELEKAYLQYYHPLFLYAFSLAGRKEDAEDLTANAFVKAIYSYREGNLKSWLYTVLKNEYISNYRKKKKLLDEGQIQLARIEDSADIVKDFIKSEQKQWLYRQIYKLPAKEREILLLSIQSELSDREIADITGYALSHIRVTRHRVKQKLIHLCEKEGIR